MVDRSGASDRRVAELESMVGELRALVQHQSARIEALEREGGGVAPVSAVAPVEPATAADAVVGRRRLLIGGATAAVAAAAAVVGSSTPAAAADGDGLVLGDQANASSATTTLTAAIDGFPVLDVVNDGTGVALQGQNTSTTIPAIYGVSTGNSGVFGGSTSGAGVRGESTSGTGISGASTSSYGVYSQSISSDSLGAISGLGIGVRAQGGGGGVYGSSTDSSGVIGESASGTGTAGFSINGPGLTGESDMAQLRLINDLDRPAPTADVVAHAVGDVVHDGAGDLWVCVAAGTPGTWRKVAGPTSAGTFHLLPSPVRVYDSRPGTAPAVGSKTKLTGNAARELSVTANSSGVPAGATAVSVTLLLVNASANGGNFTIWAAGSPRPSANAMVWGGSAGRFASTAITRISAAGKVNVAASSSTDLALDVVGYYW